MVNVAGNAEVTIESVGELLVDPEHGRIWRENYYKQNNDSPDSATRDGRGSPKSGETLLGYEARRPSSPTLKQIFGSCGRRSSSSSLAPLDRSSSNSIDSGEGQSNNRVAFHQSCFQGPRPTALLCLDTTNLNEPVIRVRRGIVNLRGLKFVHYSEGSDIWNGNAALQIQSAFGRNGRPVRVQAPSAMPTANVTDCDISSLSGRGLVAIDGGISHIHNCNIHDSAATGVYVGGAGSKATMISTDVVRNGVGNTRGELGRSVARGHSGVYVEQGLAELHDCNVSRNTLTGISAISTDQAYLHIEDSDVMGNSTHPMEPPPADTGRYVRRNTQVDDSLHSNGRPRSRFLILMQEGRGNACDGSPPSPQSPL